MPIIVAELTLIASLTGLLLLLLVALIALLSIIRQRRHQRMYRSEMRAANEHDLSVALSQLTPVGMQETLVRRPRSLLAKKSRNVITVDMPEHYRLPDQIVIQIEPDAEAPEPYNVQRLVDYLRQEMERSNQAS